MRVLYYTTNEGEHIVRNEIERLNKNEIPKVLKLVSRLEMYGQNIGGDHVKHIRGKIWELRQDRYRILYFTYIRNTFVLLRVFMKKTQRTPEQEIGIAEGRMVDYLSRFPRKLP